MAHEIIEGLDRPVFAGKPAWHGLGLVVETAPDPISALKLGGLDNEVLQAPLSAVVEGPNGVERRVVDTHVLNYRSDTRTSLGLVGVGYKPIQNRELAELAFSLGGPNAGEGVRVESAGSIRGGRKVWFLLKGDPMVLPSRAGDDVVDRYMLLANGHDGSMSMVAMPTTVRVVCSNTLHMALGKESAAIVRIKHEGDMKDKLKSARNALKFFAETGRKFEEAAVAMNNRRMTRDEVQDFFLDVYQAAEAVEIPKNPKDEKEQKVRDRAAEIIAQWSTNFDRDKRSNGSTWTALNAVTEYIDHQRKYRSNEFGVKDAALYGRMFGVGADYKHTALQRALQTV